jgi:hypothetical protein
MNSPKDPNAKKVNIVYLDKPDANCPHISVLEIPQPGDILVTYTGTRYRVVRRLFCELPPPNNQGLCDISIELDPEI